MNNTEFQKQYEDTIKEEVRLAKNINIAGEEITISNLFEIAKQANLNNAQDKYRITDFIEKLGFSFTTADEFCGWINSAKEDSNIARAEKKYNKAKSILNL